MAISKARQTFAVTSKVTIRFYGNSCGTNVLATYTDEDRIEHGTVNIVGEKHRSTDQPMTMETCIEECLQMLLNSAT